MANAVYILLFLLQGLMVGLKFQTLQRKTQPIFHGLLLTILTVELVYQYCNFISLSNVTYSVKENYLREVQGVLFNPTSFTVFGLKVALFIIEAQRCQYSVHLTTSYKVNPSVKPLIQRVINIKQSFSSLTQPISHFLFCFVAILFVLLHPSAIYVPFLPILMLAFFSSSQNSCGIFRVTSKIFIWWNSRIWISVIFRYYIR